MSDPIVVKRPSIKLPTKEPIVALQWLSKEVYPKWMFWKPRVSFLYAATKSTLYEIDTRTVTLADKFKTKVKYFTVRITDGRK